MLTVVSDTHGETGHRLAGRTLEAVRGADLVLHCGDLMTERVQRSFETEASEFRAVRGNNDTALDTLPFERVVDYRDVRVAMVHGHRHTATDMTWFARESQADLLLFGHSHRPTFNDRNDIPRLNPGSHSHPRWHRASHAELDVADGELTGRLVEPDGTVYETFAVPLEPERET